VDWRRYASVSSDPGLDPAVRTASIDLYRVRAWQGPVVDGAGRVVALGGGVAPLHRLAPSGPAAWHHPSIGGWRRGWSAAARTPVGTVALPAGRGVVWYFPAFLVALGYLVTLCAALTARSALLSEKGVGTVRSTAISEADGTE
jgi:hypothetical protein